jgi:hypothetical protein
MATLKLSSPWDEYYHELCALFKRDDEVRIVYDEDNNLITIYVEDGTKADAIAEVLPIEKKFGNMALTINVIPCNGVRRRKSNTVFEDVFYNNPIFSYVKVLPDFTGTSFVFVVFKKEVIQYYNDIFTDINGVRSTLAQDIAGNVFEVDPGTFFCTATEWVEFL